MKQKNKFGLFIILFISVAVALTYVLALRNQDIRNRAQVPQTGLEIRIHPGEITTNIGADMIAMSALLYVNGQPVYNSVTYEWSISSTNSIGTLNNINNDLARFQALNPGTGTITVHTTYLSEIITGSVPITVTPTNVSTNKRFYALLQGDQEVPANLSQATGVMTMNFNENTGSFDLLLYIKGIGLTQVNGAHIHSGATGTNGPIIFNLSPGNINTWVNESDGRIGTRLYQYQTQFPAANITDLLGGNTYINVHTPAFPGGEIRGQIISGIPSIDPQPTPNPINIQTNTVKLTADDFYIVANGKKYFAKVAGIIFGTSNTTLELNWLENGVEMRLFIYFYNDGSNWWAYEARTYDGEVKGDWITYNKNLNPQNYLYSSDYFKSPLGTPFIGDFTLNAISGYNQIPGSLYFKNLHLQAFTNIVTSTPIPTPALNCVPVNKIVTVTPPGDAGTCHSVVEAIQAAPLFGTVYLKNGNYDEFISIGSNDPLDPRDNLTITGESHNAVLKGIRLFNSNNITISNLTLKSSNWHGISVYASSNFIKIINNQILSHSKSGITIDNSNAEISGNLISQNAGQGIYLFESYNTVNIINNQIINNAQSGIVVWQCKNTINIDRNIIAENGQPGLEIVGAENVGITYNTFYHNALAGLEVSYQVGLNVTATNNIFAKSTKHPDLGIAGMGIFLSTIQDPGLILSRNLFWMNEGGCAQNMEMCTRNNSLNDTDPQFDTTNNFCLKTGSPAIYGNPNNYEYMGHRGPCGANPSPSPTTIANLVLKLRLEAVTTKKPNQFFTFKFTNLNTATNAPDYTFTGWYEANDQGIYSPINPDTAMSIVKSSYKICASHATHLVRCVTPVDLTDPNATQFTYDMTTNALLAGNSINTGVSTNLIDIYDFNNIVKNFNCKQNPFTRPAGKLCNSYASDFDFDADIDLFDYNFFAGNFGTKGDQ